MVPDFYTEPFILKEMQVFNSRIGSGTPLLQTAAHLSPGCLCEGLGHPLQLLQHNPQVLLMIRPIRSLRVARFRCQREHKLKNGLQFLLHLGGRGQKVGVRVYLTATTQWELFRGYFSVPSLKMLMRGGKLGQHVLWLVYARGGTAITIQLIS